MHIIFKGERKELPDNSIGFQALKVLEPEKKNKAIAMKVNGTVEDLSRELAEGEEVSFLTGEDKEGFEILNHSCSHLMAQAIHHLYPNAKFGYGPAIEEGFYYDVDFADEALTDAAFPSIEAEMRKLVKENLPYKRAEVSKEEALSIFKDNPYKVEHIQELEGTISTYTQGDFVDLCRGPHVPSTGYLKHFKLLSLAGAYWKGDSQNKQLTRIYATCWPSEEALKEYLAILEKRKEKNFQNK